MNGARRRLGPQTRAGIIGLLLLLLAAFPARAQQEPVKIAVLPSDSASLAYYALDRGSFKKEGLAVELLPLQSGPAIAAAVASGAADFGAANIIALAVAREKGLPFVAVSPAGVYTSKAATQGLVVPKNSSLKTAKSLAGHVIAVDSLKTLATISISAWTDRNGGDSTALKYVELPFGQMGAALDTGRVEAAFIPEPILSNVLAGNARLLAAPLDAIASELQLGAWFTRADYFKAHPDIVRSVVAVLAENAVWAMANKAAAGQAYQRQTKIPITDRTQRMQQSGRADFAQLQPLIDAAAKYGVLKASFPARELYSVPAR
jgi:NitT/TauT family transport system substrate-binding protein